MVLELARPSEARCFPPAGDFLEAVLLQQPQATEAGLHTEAFTHKHFYTQTLLHTDAFTHRRFYTQTSPAQVKSQFSSVFAHRPSFRAKALLQDK